MLIPPSRKKPLRRTGLAALYTALALGANPALAQDDLAALRAGDMKKLTFAETNATAPDDVLSAPGGGERRLADYRGKHVVLNFWATWCAPCREEMASLDALAAALGGETLAVVPVATGRNPLPAVRRFYEAQGIDSLPMLRDPDQSLARKMGVLGLPVTVILDREGREIARLPGDADWNSDSAQAILTALTGDG